MPIFTAVFTIYYSEIQYYFMINPAGYGFGSLCVRKQVVPTAFISRG